MSDESLTLPVVGREEFRRRLAGLIDPGRQIQPAEVEAFRGLARDVVVSLCVVYGTDLDRKTIWSRIDGGVQAACARVDDGDTDRWLDLLLDHVRAEAARVVRLGLLRSVRASLASRDDAHRRAFLRWVGSHRYAVLAQGRAAWEEWKAANRFESARAGGAAKGAGAGPAEIRAAAAGASELDRAEEPGGELGLDPEGGDRA